MRKTIALFFTAALSLLLLGSCEETYKSTFSFGIGSYEPASDTESLDIIKSYLSEVGCFIDPMTFESGSVTQNEQDAIVYFDTNAERIDEKVLASRLSGRNVKFSYVVAEGNSIDPSGSNYVKSVAFTFGSYAVK